MYGYARVSTKEQNEDRQLIALYEFGVAEHNVYLDKLSGKDFNRPQYKDLICNRLKTGDLLVIKSLDRLGRNYNEILKEWRYITKELKADIKILDMPLLDTRLNKDLLGTFISDLVLQVLSFVSENERDIIRKRQAEGIRVARLKGRHLGRPVKPIPDGFPEIYKDWRAGNITARDAWERSGLRDYQFYKMARKYEKSVIKTI